MKLDKQTADTIKIGETNSKQAKISEHKISKLQYILTKGLYSDPITATIAEITNNGIDSVIQSGKDPIKNPVLVEIGRNEQSNYFFRVTDKGVGLDQNEFENIVMNYLESTKENDDNSIGYFGLGSKSFLSLERAATFTCRKNGKELKYLVYQGSEFCEYDLLYEIDTQEENGVIFEIPIKDVWERNDFIRKAKQKLAYYDTVALTVDGKLEENSIIRSQDWQYSSENKETYLHLCLKDVFYPIDFDKLGITNKKISIPIALRFNLTDGLSVTPNREQLIYNEKVKNLIRDKITIVADWFATKYNSSVPDEYDSIIEHWADLTKSSKEVVINNIKFELNSLLQFSSITVKEFKIKGIKFRFPSYYQTITDHILSEYGKLTFKTSGGTFYSAKSYLKQFTLPSKVLRKDTLILVDSLPLGYVRQYLSAKYDNKHTVFIEKKWDRKFRPNNQIFGDRDNYYHMLYLRNSPRAEWRGRVEEFQRVEKEFKDKIIDERGVENTQDFKDWLVKHKELLKATGKYNTSGNYKVLNKQNGDITLSIGRCGITDTDKVVFEKKVFKINELYKVPTLFVLFDTKEEAEKYWKILNKSKGITICMIGNREISKLPEFKTKKFIKFAEFMEKDIKPFQRIASAILYSKTLNDFEEIRAGRKEIFNEFLSSYVQDFKALKAYVNDNYSGADEEIENAILAVAKEKNLFDKQFWDIYLRVKSAVQRFDFFTCFKTPPSWESETQKKYKKVINQMLLFQKKYYDLEGYELVKKSETLPTPAVVVEEEEEVVAF